MDESNENKGKYAFVANDDYNDITLVISKFTDTNSSNGWYLDYICVTHICS